MKIYSLVKSVLLLVLNVYPSNMEFRIFSIKYGNTQTDFCKRIYMTVADDKLEVDVTGKIAN